MNKLLEKAGASSLQNNALYPAMLAGDLLSNAFYYSFIGAGNKKYLIYRGIAFDTAAGIGAIRLTGPLNLNDAPVTRTEKTKAMIVAYYLISGW
jgi:hypothetical protein